MSALDRDDDVIKFVINEDPRFRITNGNEIWIKRGQTFDHVEEDTVSLVVKAIDDGTPRMKHISLITFEVRDPTDAPDSANTTPIGLGNRNASIETQQLPPQMPFDMSDSLPNDAAEPIDSLIPEMI